MKGGGEVEGEGEGEGEGPLLPLTRIVVLPSCGPLMGRLVSKAGCGKTVNRTG